MYDTYLLTCIDEFSKYTWVRCLKTGTPVSNAFKEVLSEGHVPEKLQTDQGTQFYNKHLTSTGPAEDHTL